MLLVDLQRRLEESFKSQSGLIFSLHESLKLDGGWRKEIPAELWEKGPQDGRVMWFPD